MKIVKYSWLFMCLLPTIAMAQNFSYKAKIEPVNKDGFYKVQLSSQMSAYANPFLTDVRIMDNDGKEVPYLLKKEDAYQSESDFVNYTFTEDNVSADWQTIIIDNENKSDVEQFVLEMKNAETDRVVRMSGSNDKGKWFVVRDSFYFSAAGMNNTSTIRMSITFPKSDYRYFKLEIKKKGKEPLNILNVGYTNEVFKMPSYMKVQGVTYTQKDSNKKTILNVLSAPANRIDKLVFYISSPTMFKRDGVMKKHGEDIDSYSGSNESVIMSKKYKRGNYNQTEVFELNSNSQSRVIYTDGFLGREKIEDFSIEINNNDNEALHIDSIVAYQLTSSVIAEFKKDKKYFLYFGDSLLDSPSYDLQYFESKIPANSPLLTIGDVQPKSAKVDEEYNQSKDKWMVWIGIGIIAIILFLMTGNMMKKMNKV